MNTADRLAVIEVGSKGIRLLVAERRPPPEGFEALKSLGDVGNLGEDLEKNDGRMRRDNVERSLELVRKFLRVSKPLRPDKVVLVGTEVFRRATNRDEFRAGLPRSLELRVLTPEEESVGSFLAAGWGFRDGLAPGGRLVLIDLGGGSVEVVCGVQAVPPLPVAGASLPGIGTFALHDVWRTCPDPAAREEELQRHIGAELGRHEAELVPCRAAVADGPAAGRLLVAGLGSAVTDSAWALRQGSREGYRSAKVHGLQAGVAELEGLRHRLLEAGEPGSTDTLEHQLGLAALLAVLRHLNAPGVTACGTGLRFGLAYAFLNDVPLTLPH